MAGASIHFEFHDASFRRALARMVDPKLRTGLMHAIGVGLRDNVTDRFRRGVGPDGQPWAGLNPAYAAMKRGRGILVESGMLQGSMTFRSTADTATVGTDRIYGAIHQFGGVIRPKGGKRALVFRLGGRLVFAGSVRIPARPYLGWGPEDDLVVRDALDVLLPGGR